MEITFHYRAAGDDTLKHDRIEVFNKDGSDFTPESTLRSVDEAALKAAKENGLMDGDTGALIDFSYTMNHTTTRTYVAERITQEGSHFVAENASWRGIKPNLVGGDRVIDENANIIERPELVRPARSEQPGNTNRRKFLRGLAGTTLLGALGALGVNEYEKAKTRFDLEGELREGTMNQPYSHQFSPEQDRAYAQLKHFMDTPEERPFIKDLVKKTFTNKGDAGKVVAKALMYSLMKLKGKESDEPIKRVIKDIIEATPFPVQDITYTTGYDTNGPLNYDLVTLARAGSKHDLDANPEYAATLQQMVEAQAKALDSKDFTGVSTAAPQRGAVVPQQSTPGASIQ